MSKLDIITSLTFDDVLLLPAFSEILPKEASLKTKLTKNISLNIPLLSAAMDTVTESKMAITMAQEGGIGIIHKNMSEEKQAAEVKKVKKYESGIIKHPITITADATVKEAMKLRKQENISALPVIDANNIIKGLATSRDLRFVNDLDTKIFQVMTPKEKLITAEPGVSPQEVIHLLARHKIERLLIVDKQDKLQGMITLKDIQKSKNFPNASKDSNGSLLVGAAIGVSKNGLKRAEYLIKAGVDVLVVDTAHGHSKYVLETVQWLKQNHPKVDIIAGNIATKEAALDLLKVGVDGIKVGIGPGSICTTRIVAGVGVPQISAINNVYKALENTGVALIADGGINFSGDIAKAIAAGASSVMIGSMFAGTNEAPGEIEYYNGRAYKPYRGMGSLGAMGQIDGSSDRYFQEDSQKEKLVPEGVEGRVPFKGKVSLIVHQLIGGLRSSMGYTGNATIEAMHKNAKFTRITGAGMKESHVHGVTITKESPNYSI